MIIAIKGLIGSGKTTTSEYLQEKYGAYHYNCDARVKHHYQYDKKVINRVNREVLNTDSKAIDMQVLREVAFSDKSKLDHLEMIIYPYIQCEIDNLAEAEDIVLLDCQQIDKMDVNIDYVLYVQLSDSNITKRVIERDKRTGEQIAEILKIQKGYEVGTVSFTVENNGSKQELYEKLDAVMEAINEKTSR